MLGNMELFLKRNKTSELLTPVTKKQLFIEIYS